MVLLQPHSAALVKTMFFKTRYCGFFGNPCRRPLQYKPCALCQALWAKHYGFLILAGHPSSDSFQTWSLPSLSPSLPPSHISQGILLPHALLCMPFARMGGNADPLLSSFLAQPWLPFVQVTDSRLSLCNSQTKEYMRFFQELLSLHVSASKNNMIIAPLKRTDLPVLLEIIHNLQRDCWNEYILYLDLPIANFLLRELYHLHALAL